MKIRLIIGRFSTYGGAEVIAYRFALFLLRKGLLHEVVCGRNEILNFPDKIKELRIPKAGRFLKTLLFQKKTLQYLNENNHDKNIVNFAFSKVPQCHVYRNGGGTHKGFLELSIKAFNGAEKLKKRITRALNPINYYNPYLEKKIFSSSKKIIAISTKVKEEIIKYYGTELESKISIIPNGIDLIKFNPQKRKELRFKERSKLNFSNNDFIIGFASSNFKLKGLEYIIKALPLLDERIKLVVAGGRNPKHYISIAKKLRVENRIKFLGKVSNIEVFYAVIDCLVHPSFYDTFGNVVAEALSMNIPVIVSKYTGAKDLIVSGKNGFILNEINETQIARLIRKTSKLIPDFSVNQIYSDEEVFSRYLNVAEQSLFQEQT